MTRGILSHFFITNRTPNSTPNGPTAQVPMMVPLLAWDIVEGRTGDLGTRNCKKRGWGGSGNHQGSMNSIYYAKAAVEAAEISNKSGGGPQFSATGEK